MTDLYTAVVKIADSAMFIFQPTKIDGNISVNYFCESVIVKEANHYFLKTESVHSHSLTGGNKKLYRPFLMMLLITM